MRRFYLGTSLAVVTTAAILLNASAVFADRGGHSGRGSGGGGGGGGGSSSRSFSGGGGGGGNSSFRSSSGGSSSRSMGDSSRSSSRSFSADGGSRSSSMRSFNMSDGGGRSSSSSLRSSNFGSGGSSSRTLSSGSFSSRGSGNSGQSSRALSSGSSSNVIRSFSGSDAGTTSRAFRATQSQSDRGNYRPAPRSFGSVTNDGSNNSGGQSTVKSFRGSGSGSFQPGVSRGNLDRSQFDAFLNNKSADQSSRLGSSNTNDSNSGGRPTIYGQQLGSNSKQGAGGSFRGDPVRRPSDDEVRSFLNMRNQTAGGKGPGNDSNGQSQDQNVATDRGALRNGGNTNRGDASRVGDKLSADPGKRLTAAAKPFDRDGKDAKHDGQGAFKGPGSKGPGELGDGKNNAIGKDFNRDGRGDREGRDRDFNRGKDFRGSDAAKAEFANWQNVWKGKNGDGRDHRDWSGKWKDGDRFDVANSIRRDWHNRRDHHNFPFRGDWWRHGRHHGWHFWHDYAFHRHRPWFWWGWASSPVLTSWCGFGWSTPYYWDYGPGEYIYCNNGVVYVNGAWYQPAPVYYQQTVQLVQKTPVLAQEVAAQVEWLPLGVFAVTPDGLNEATVMVQLAVTKDGVIGGTAFDQKAGASFNIQGTIDKNTQRAVWSYEDAAKRRIIMETSVNNLTQNEATGLVHYSPNDMRVIELVRLQEPAGPAGELPAPPQPQLP